MISARRRFVRSQDSTEAEFQPVHSLQCLLNSIQAAAGSSSQASGLQPANARKSRKSQVSKSKFVVGFASIQLPGKKGIHKRRVPQFTVASVSEKASDAKDAVGHAAQGAKHRTGHTADKLKHQAAGSAHEAGKEATVKVNGVPAWRIVLGNIAAGATAGCAVEAALYPLDTIKTRLQLMIKGQGIKALFRSGGGRNLYAGVWGNLVGVAPASAVFMGIYEPVKAHITERVSPDKSFLGPLGAGAAAGFVASVIRVPTEVVKQRLQSGEFQRGAVDAVRNIIKHEGVRGLFAGYSSFMIRDLPFDAIEFVAYEQLKKAYKIQVSRELNPAETSAIGAIAGAVTGVATTPLDVVKTRLMTQGTSQRYKNVVDCFSKIIKEEGASTLLQGWQPRVIWIGLGGMVFFTALEEAKKLYAPKQFNHETL